MVTASIQYRRWDRSGKGNTVFDCVKDGRSAIRYLRENATELGIDPNKIVVSGGSAGGHVAVSTSLFDDVNESTDNLKTSCRPDLMVLLNPVIDTSEIGFGQSRIGERWQELSPVHHVKPGLPPTIIFHATGDQVVPYIGEKHFHDQSLKLDNESELVNYEGGWHGYFIFNLKLYDGVVSRIETWLKSKGYLKERLTPFTPKEPGCVKFEFNSISRNIVRVCLSWVGSDGFFDAHMMARILDSQTFHR